MLQATHHKRVPRGKPEPLIAQVRSTARSTLQSSSATKGTSAAATAAVTAANAATVAAAAAEGSMRAWARNFLGSMTFARRDQVSF